MANLVLCRHSELLIFIKDRMILYNFVNKEHQLIHISEPLVNPQRKLTESRHVVSARFSKDQTVLAVIMNNKQLILYDNQFNIVCNVTTNRTCSNVRFTNENDVVVADKTGDVYLYKLECMEIPILLLGHLSMVLDVTLSDCGNHLITCDRDEKIRVSCFPNCYNIKSYCLGHTEFVTNVEVHNSILISASGDGNIRTWDFLNGKQLSITKTGDFVEDKNIIEEFCKHMDADKVDVQTLPIVDFKMYKFNEALTVLGVSLLDYKGLQIYNMQEPCTELSIKFSENLMVQSKVISFSLNSQLFILTCSNIHVYSLNNSRYKEVNSFSLAQIYNDYKLVEMSNEDEYNINITTLYKRKYDNVHDYMEKKKLRLATKV